MTQHGSLHLSCMHEFMMDTFATVLLLPQARWHRYLMMRLGCHMVWRATRV